MSKLAGSGASAYTSRVRTITAPDIAAAHPHAANPDDVLAVAYGRRLRAVAAGRVVVDTQHAWVVWLPGLPPVPRWGCSEADVDAPWLVAFAGDGVERVEGPNGDLVVFVRADVADAWFEEDEQVHVHPRDPFGRVEVRASSRHVVVRAHGQVVADTRRAQLLYETGLPLRCYIPRADVAPPALAPSGTRTSCPYKGVARHFHVDAGGERIEDGAWAYPLPRSDLPQITDHVCFYEGDVTTVTIEGLDSTPRADDR